MALLDTVVMAFPATAMVESPTAMEDMVDMRLVLYLAILHLL